MMRLSKRKLQACLFLLIGSLSRDAYGQAAFDLLAKARPDEFFAGIGQGYYPLGQQPADLPGQPKVNHGYLWGMATDGRYIWFGTAVDTIPYATTGLDQIGVPRVFTSPQKQIPFRVSEYGQSKYPGTSGLNKILNGDWRPPQAFRYDTQTQALVDFTPNDPLINQTFGFRAVGLANGVVFLAGQALSGSGICLFAFDAETGASLGSLSIPWYDDIRRWQLVGGQLYTAVRNSIATQYGGTVLRWTGSRQTPFRFEIVGLLDGEGASIVAHEGRLVCGTWQGQSVISSFTGRTAPNAGIWVSPVIPPGGLQARHAPQWTKIWDASRYEPDPVIAQSYAMGAMASFGDHLYFGTMHFPEMGAKMIQREYLVALSPADQLKANRAAIVVRAKDLGAAGGPAFELVYGDGTVSVYSPNTSGPGSWSQAPTGMGGPGRFGTSGLGDPNNLYLWSAAVHQNQLYLGTLDVGSVTLNFGELVDGVPKPTIGGDLYRISSPTTAGVPLSIKGCGNQANHGIVNMVSTPSGLYLGTANAMNLLTDPYDNLPDGGWELLRLRTTP